MFNLIYSDIQNFLWYNSSRFSSADSLLGRYWRRWLLGQFLVGDILLLRLATEAVIVRELAILALDWRQLAVVSPWGFRLGTAGLTAVTLTGALG